MEHDVVVRGGTVVDGTGAPGYEADVAIDHGTVVAIGASLRGAVELDASGCHVAPGFVDVHTHYDAQVLWDPACDPSLRHGTTTVIAGNCGFSIAPARDDLHDLLVRTLEHTEGMNATSLEAGIDWSFGSFREYLATIEHAGTIVNYATYVAHSALRLYVMGDDAYERPARGDEIATMCELAAAALDDGAVGLSTSTSPTHIGDRGRPVPSRLAAREELAAFARLLAARGRVLSIIPGAAVPIEEVYELARTAGCRATWNPLVARPNHGHDDEVAFHERQSQTGADVRPQVTCREIWLRMTLRSPFILDAMPSFGSLHALGDDGRRAKFRDPAWRDQAHRETDDNPIVRWHAMRVEESVADPATEGRTIADLARERSARPLDVMVDLALADDLDTRFVLVAANDDEHEVARLLTLPGVLLGLSDAGAHLDMLCDACMPTDLLGNWVRQRGVLTVEHAVHKLTAEPARFFGLARGEIAVGAAADLCVFDLDAIAPGPVRRADDLPAGAERLVADQPSGIAHVLVNGVPVVRDGRWSPGDRRPGTIVGSVDAAAGG